MKNLSKFALVCALGMFGFNVMAEPVAIPAPGAPGVEKKVETVKKDEAKKDEVKK